MTKPKRAPGNVAPPRGRAVSPDVPAVLPPDGWVKDSPFGFLRYEGGDLARLGDVQPRRRRIAQARVEIRREARSNAGDVSHLWGCAAQEDRPGGGYGQQAAPAGADAEAGSVPDVSTWAGR